MLLFARNKNFHLTPLLIRDGTRLMIRILHMVLSLFALGQLADFLTRGTKQFLTEKLYEDFNLILWKLYLLCSCH